MQINKQQDKQQRGLDFQNEIRRSWALVPGTWRMRIPDGKGGSRPADELILTESCNILAEMKRTQSDRFQLSYLEPNQVKGLLDFDNVIPRNFGMVFISFLSEDVSRDTAYAFRLTAAINYMMGKNKKFITMAELDDGAIPSVKLTRIATTHGLAYDLKGVIHWYKSLYETI